MFSNQDHLFLARTLSLSRKGGAAVRPNPLVGAVVVKNGDIIAEGYHAVYGGPHAEARALEQAGEHARGAQLYCNLEPCSFSAPDKHNEPCTLKIIRAGVTRVVVGQLDPNPRVRGGGVEQLRKAGIEVELAPDLPEQREIWYSNARFNTVHALHRPFISLKLAQSLDGRIAASGGDSKWISNAAARKEVHYMRADHDAVLVGIGTALSDNPRLTVRITESPPQIAQQPRAVVLDAKARLPLRSFLVKQRAGELIVYTVDTSGSADSFEAGLFPQHFSARELQDIQARVQALRAAGVQVRPAPLDESAHLSLQHILPDLMQMGIQSVMVEGGAELAGAFLSCRLYDALHLYIAPILIGGDGKGIGPLNVGKVADALQLEEVEVRAIDGHVAVTGFRGGWYAGVTRVLKEESYVHGAC